jgi:hypothetical protein
VGSARFWAFVLRPFISDDAQVTGVHVSAGPLWALLLCILGPPLLLTLFWVWLRRKPPRAPA